MRRFFWIVLICLLAAAVPVIGTVGRAGDTAVTEVASSYKDVLLLPSENAAPETPESLESAPAPTPVPEPAAAKDPLDLILQAPSLPPEGIGQDEVFILVRISEQKLYLYRGATLLASYPVSTGAPDTPTPPGPWRISQKLKYAQPVPQYGSRWMRIDQFDPMSGGYEWSDYGIHGTDEPQKIGTLVSTGCVRLLNKDVNALFDVVSLGTFVLISM